MKWSLAFLMLGVANATLMFVSILAGTFHSEQIFYAACPLYIAWLHSDLERTKR